MCGIVALFIKDAGYEAGLGMLFKPMLEKMCGRGPDSAGFAIYNGVAPEGAFKLSLHHPTAGHDWTDLAERIKASLGHDSTVSVRSSHAFFVVQGDQAKTLEFLAREVPDVTVMSAGKRIMIMKETGTPQEVAERFDLESISGSHVIGHTRMATESAVSTAGSHPFSTGGDICLVHNGSLSNHNRLRKNLRREGIQFRTDNDSEVAAGYLMWRLGQGLSLEGSLEAALSDLDGFYTFAVGTRDGFAVLRDPVACKPAVMAETDAYVAMASEYRSLSSLPGIRDARLWEPEPATVYSWSHS